MEWNDKEDARADPTQDRAERAAREEGPKTSSLAPVAAHTEPTPTEVKQPESPDLLPRVVTVTLGITVVSLIALYAIRQPPRVGSAVAPQQDVESVAGAEDDTWLRDYAPELGVRRLSAQPAEKTSDVGVHMGATAAGPGFDMISAIQSFDAAQLRTAGCWADAKTDNVTIAVRFIPEGLAVSAEVADRKVVGDQAAACFEREFRRTSVPSFVGEETTIRRTMQRP